MIRRISLTLVLVLAATACAGGGSGSEPGSSPEAGVYTTIQGDDLVRADVAGPAVVFARAPGQPLCLMQADAVAWLHLQTGEDVQFIGVASNNSFDEIVETAARVHIDGFPQIVDTNGQALAHFGFTSHPALMFIDGAGNRTLKYGAIDPMAALEAVKALPKAAADI